MFRILIMVSHALVVTQADVSAGCPSSDSDKKDCGHQGITIQQCIEMGCCYGYQSHDFKETGRCYRTVVNNREDETKMHLSAIERVGGNYEDACLKTFELYLLTSKGRGECMMNVERRINCIPHEEGRNILDKCRTCTKLGCCYDHSAAGSGIPYCYKAKNSAKLNEPTIRLLKSSWADIINVRSFGSEIRKRLNPPSTSPSSHDTNRIRIAMPVYTKLLLLSFIQNSLRNDSSGTIGDRTGNDIRNVLWKVLQNSAQESPQSNFMQSNVGNANDARPGNTFGQATRGFPNKYQAHGRDSILGPINQDINTASGLRQYQTGKPHITPQQTYSGPDSTRMLTNSQFKFGRVVQNSALSNLLKKRSSVGSLLPGGGMESHATPSHSGDIFSEGSTISNPDLLPNSGTKSVKNVHVVEQSAVDHGNKSHTNESISKPRDDLSDRVTIYHDNTTFDELINTCYPENCGAIGLASPSTVSQRIVGGQPAGDIGYWPWMASFRRNYPDDPKFRHICGATLISKRWIITAGHCFVFFHTKLEAISGEAETKIESFAIWFGTYFISGVEFSSQIGLLDRFITHPKYDFASLKYDIAVAKLEEDLFISTFVRPVCLPPKDIQLSAKDTVWVTGWGATLNISGNGTKLKELPLPLISLDECWKRWETPKKYQKKDRICTEEAFLEDTCWGDSGGPLVHETAMNRWNIVGVAIAGTEMCSTDRNDLRPGIYTNVAYYRDFIDHATKGAC